MGDNGGNFFPGRLKDGTGRFPVIRYADLDAENRAFPGPSSMCTYSISGQGYTAPLFPGLWRWPVRGLPLSLWNRTIRWTSKKMANRSDNHLTYRRAVNIFRTFDRNDIGTSHIVKNRKKSQVRAPRQIMSFLNRCPKASHAPCLEAFGLTTVTMNPAYTFGVTRWGTD